MSAMLNDVLIDDVSGTAQLSSCLFSSSLFGFLHVDAVSLDPLLGRSKCRIDIERKPLSLCLDSVP